MRNHRELRSGRRFAVNTEQSGLVIGCALAGWLQFPDHTVGDFDVRSVADGNDELELPRLAGLELHVIKRPELKPVQRVGLEQLFAVGSKRNPAQRDHKSRSEY